MTAAFTHLALLILVLSLSAANADLFSHPVATLTQPSGGASADDSSTYKLTGKYTDTTAVFHGIPFAKPPVDDLRFCSPAPIVDEQADARVEFPKSMCPQFSITKNIHLGSEDCLYLSVYVPKNKNSGIMNNDAFPPKTPLPVMFWIFGGAFVVGDDTEFGFYHGENLAHNEDVIVVTANYRVGAFGFLAHERLMEEDEVGSTGNMGIQDQRMALQWVQDNIAAFGGDPNDVTIFGESAGGMSVCTHVANNVNQGLFSRAIMESGTCNSPEFYQKLPDALDFGKTYSDIVGCSSSTPDETSAYLECMRGKRTSEIMYGMLKAWELFKRADPDDINVIFGNGTTFLPTLAPLMPFGPVIDSTAAGMPKLPYDSIAAGEHNKVPFMLGTNSNEGSIFLPMIASVVKGVKHLPLKSDDVPVVIHHVLDPVVGEETVTENLPELLDIYNVNDYESVDAQVSHILRDYMFVCSTRRAAREFTRTSGDVPVFMYQFNYHARWADFKLLGCYHGSELYFVFDNAFPPVVHHFDKDDKEMAGTIQNYWTTFAMHGDPNGEDSETMWHGWTEDEEEYMELNLPSVGKSRLQSDQCDFHDKFLGYA